MCTLFHCACINSALFFSLCSYWAEDGGQEQVSGCTHHPPVMRGNLSTGFEIEFLFWVSNSASTSALCIFMLDVMKLMSCVRHEVSQELYPCFKCFYQFCVHIVQSFCKCVEVLFLLLNCWNICLLFLFMYVSASSHFFYIFWTC